MVYGFTVDQMMLKQLCPFLKIDSRATRPAKVVHICMYYNQQITIEYQMPSRRIKHAHVHAGQLHSMIELFEEPQESEVIDDQPDELFERTKEPAECKKRKQ